MKENFDEFISKLQEDLPDLVTPEMLVSLGVASHVRLFRIRQNGEIPFLKLSSARILYLKPDVIAWIRKIYHDDVLMEKEANTCNLE